MKGYIIITSINAPTEAVYMFAQKQDWKVVVVGDVKTPSDWYCDDVEYLSIEKQKQYAFDLPYNHYARKMIGYLYAIQNNADIIVDTDDDNIPYNDWSFPDKGLFQISRNKDFINIYGHYTHNNIWPRGLPLNYIYRVGCFETKKTVLERQVGIWQGLADYDPDVDAIYRLAVRYSCKFDNKEPVVLSKETVSPFNSQNTLFKKELFALLYLPVTVNQRFSDILRSYVAQPILWKADYLLGFTKATVYQKRNPHNLMKDFIDELPCYLQSEDAYTIARQAIQETTIENNLILVYDALIEAGIVKAEEREYLQQWLNLIKT